MLHALASIFRGLVGGGGGGLLLVLWVGLWCVGVTVCLVSGRGGRAFLGVRVLSSGLWWTRCGSCVSMEPVGPGGARVR